MPGIRSTLHEFKEGKLHSGSKKGPKVKSRKQAIAIAMSEDRKAGGNDRKMHKGEAFKAMLAKMKAHSKA